LKLGTPFKSAISTKSLEFLPVSSPSSSSSDDDDDEENCYCLQIKIVSSLLPLVMTMKKKHY
jgi:hypothetical protein